MRWNILLSGHSSIRTSISLVHTWTAGGSCLIDVNSLPPWQLLVIVPVIAFLYASIGFGGASGYLAAMSVLIIPTSVMSSTALTLNVFVSSVAFIAFYRARHFTPRLLWPFLLTSLPAAFIGGYIQISTDLFLVLLYLSLSFVCSFSVNPKMIWR